MKEKVKVPVEDPKDTSEKKEKEGAKKVEEEKEPDLVQWLTI